MLLAGATRAQARGVLAKGIGSSAWLGAEGVLRLARISTHTAGTFLRRNPRVDTALSRAALLRLSHA